MNRRQMVHLLKRNGFRLVRTGKHETYAKDGVQIQVPSSGKELNWRLEKQMLIQIRKMLGNNTMARGLVTI